MKFNPFDPSISSGSPRAESRGDKLKASIPEEIINIAETLKKANFQLYLVGGCVRDLLMNRQPKDWDIATNAKPEQIQKIFPNSVYENQFGTVGVKTNSKKPALKIVEITTFRLEGKYTDKRHPDEIKFAKTIKDDLSRRDFTINAMAAEIQFMDVGHPLDVRRQNIEIIDPFDGQKDLENKIIRAVGEPEQRFGEDALRMIRAVRFAVELNFTIDNKTSEAINKHSALLEIIAKERIRDEFIKIITTNEASQGIMLLEKLGLLKYILPELRQGIGATQNLHHIYEIFEHHIRALDYSAKQNYSLEIRLAALLHDLGKPKTKQGQGYNATFHGHEMLSAKMTAQALQRLCFPKEIIEKISHLVRYHMFYYNVGEVSEAGVRRFLARVGPENVDDLLKLREADRIGSGTPKAVPYKNRHLLFMIEKVKHDPLSPKMLKVNGNDAMEILKIPAGPKVGQILAILLDEVIENPKRNSIENLKLKIEDLGKLSDAELKKLAKKASERKNEFESGIEEKMKKKYWVK